MTSAVYEALARALTLKETETRQHCRRVARLAVAVAEMAGFAHEATCPDAAAGYYLHDVGKLGVPDAVLGRPDSVGPIDRMALDRHPLHGAYLVAGVGDPCGCAAAVVRHHHERWDGGGYPDHLSGEAVPPAARVFAVADAIDAMCNDQPYRRALPPEQVVAELTGGAGTQFDPHVVGAVVPVLDVVLATAGLVPRQRPPAPQLGGRSVVGGATALGERGGADVPPSFGGRHAGGALIPPAAAPG